MSATYTWYRVRNANRDPVKCPHCGLTFESLTFIYPASTPLEQVKRIADDFGMCDDCSSRAVDYTDDGTSVEILIGETNNG